MNMLFLIIVALIMPCYCVSGLNCWATQNADPKPLSSSVGKVNGNYSTETPMTMTTMKCHGPDETRCALTTCKIGNNSTEFAGCGNERSCERAKINCERLGGMLVDCKLCETDQCNQPQAVQQQFKEE